jgi:hypothetical protein
MKLVRFETTTSRENKDKVDRSSEGSHTKFCRKRVQTHPRGQLMGGINKRTEKALL